VAACFPSQGQGPAGLSPFPATLSVCPLILTFHAGNVNLGYTLNKGCSPICPSENVNLNLGVASVNSYCCQSSFCNFSAAGLGLRASIPLLGLGLLLSLLALLQLSP
ncbi:lymphocyte antigen 6 complex, locus E, isoform CRA_c, partial [Mus musculus]